MNSGRGSIQAVFWDMDGTLIDTEYLHYEVIRDWCARHGYVLTEAANEELLGKSMPEKWNLLRDRLAPTAGEQAFQRECGRDYIDRLRPEMMRPETVAVVRALAQKGVLQACVSNGDPEVIDANLRMIGIESLMAFTVSGRDVAYGKPAPDPYLEAALRAGLEPGQCLAVEDSPVGLSAALAAGCHTCAWPGESVEGLPEVHCFIREAGEFPWHLIAG
ncbi:HAD family hydrolase [Salidesulfovibrio onnuriiensis]|uniref:HAD family hydrolase n=1 Tax=Salidesulfovibrio onnuriiensis TaxID=2583823 RepID=UPI0011CA9009|nr:HAD family phosphatase [Salidesulfovibrio onnuriiensis]